MQTGVITPDNLSQVLREISQKRKSGIFEINCVEYMIFLHFMHGKILEVVDTRKLPVQELFERLQLAGYIPEDMECSFAGEAEPYKALFLALNEDPESAVVDEDLYRLAIKHRILDKLYGLDLGSGAYYNFKLQMPSGERDYLPNLPVGTLLLDLVALESDAPRFQDLFSEEVKVSRVSDVGSNRNEEEDALFQALGEPIAVEQLRVRSLLSSFHVQDILLSMYDKGELEITSQAEEEVSATDPATEPATEPEAEPIPDDTGGDMVDDLVAALEASIDESFSEAAAEVSAIGTAVENNFPDAQQESEADYDEEEYEDEEYEDDEYEEEWDGPGVGGRINVLSMKLLHSDWVPSAIGLVFAAFALLLPFFNWRVVLALFSGY